MGETTPVIPEAVRRMLGYTARLDEIQAAKELEKKGTVTPGIRFTPVEGLKFVTVEVYVCPYPGCPEYFGHANMPDLGERLTGPKTEDRDVPGAREGRPRYPRATCPTCRQAGRNILRIRTTATVAVPTHQEHDDGTTEA